MLAVHTQDLELRLEEGSRIVVTPAATPHLAWQCALRGRVVEGSAVATARRLSFLLRPFPEVIRLAQGVLEIEVAWTLDDMGGGVTLELAGPTDYPIGDLPLPGPISPRETGAWHLLTPQLEGEVQRIQAGFTQHRTVHADLTLPLIALLHGNRADRGSLLFFTPQGEDHAVQVESASDGSPLVELVQQASLGRWRYGRTWRVVAVAALGLIELAAVVRGELRATGLSLKPLPERLEAIDMPPELRDSIGGVHLWWHIDPLPADLPAQLRQSGLRSVLLQGFGPAAEAARAHGFVFAPYYQTSDILPPGFGEPLEWRHIFPPADVTVGWPDQLLRDRAGWPERNWFHIPAAASRPYWSTEDYLTEAGTVSHRAVAQERFASCQGYSRCPTFYGERVQTFGLPTLEEGGFTGVFYDVLTASGAKECFAPEHSCDRREDLRRRREAFGAVAATGRYVGSEFGRWWALDLLLGLEGTLTRGEWSANHAVVADYPFRAEWWDSQFNLAERVPFFGMVARHCVARTLWWGQGNDRHAETWGAKDALCALYGGNPIFISDPAHMIAPGSPRWDGFVKTARAFDDLRRRTAGAAIVRHEALSKHVGVTEFEGGTVVHANTGPAAADGLPAGSFRIE